MIIQDNSNVSMNDIAVTPYNFMFLTFLKFLLKISQREHKLDQN